MMPPGRSLTADAACVADATTLVPEQKPPFDVVALAERLEVAADWLDLEHSDDVCPPDVLDVDGPSINHEEVLAYCVKLMREAASLIVGAHVQ